MTLTRLDPELLYVIVFGPGFGESIVVRPPDSDWLFVDSCYDQPDKVPAVELLEELGDRRGCAILTHPHQDHGMGFDEIISTTGDGPVGCTLPVTANPDIVRESPRWRMAADDIQRLHNGRLASTIRAIRDRWQTDPGTKWDLRRGDRRQIGELTLEVLHPDEETLEGSPTNFNDISSPILVEWHNLRVLLGADLPGSLWEQLPEELEQLGQHALLKVPHHGSASDVSIRYGAEGPQDRFWIVTPYNRGTTQLPSFGDDDGISKLLNHVDEVHLTSLPKSKAAPRNLHREIKREDIETETDTGISSIGGIEPASLNRKATDDEYRCFAAAGFDREGNLEDTKFGAGSRTIQRS